MKTRIKLENRDGQPRMTRMARMKRNFCTQLPETIRTEPRERNAFIIRVFREIRGFSFETLLLPALIALLNLIPAGRVTAQTFTTLHSFTATSGSFPSTNSDGAKPEAGLRLGDLENKEQLAEPPNGVDGFRNTTSGYSWLPGGALQMRGIVSF